ncbi:MAG: hypothetical protein V7L01_30235 [Nostoc sp.]|uniref:hypothetical protein n=1 Tax=Nostoc sp. TaxID=1180 RepID=UPI002FF862BE
MTTPGLIPFLCEAAPNPFNFFLCVLPFGKPLRVYASFAVACGKPLTLLLCETLRERRYRFANASTFFFLVLKYGLAHLHTELVLRKATSFNYGLEEEGDAIANHITQFLTPRLQPISV